MKHLKKLVATEEGVTILVVLSACAVGLAWLLVLP